MTSLGMPTIEGVSGGAKAMRYIVLMICCITVAAPAAAQIGLYIYPDDPDVGCNFVQSLNPQSVYVVVTGDWRGARFTFSSPCVQVNSVEPMNGVTLTGDIATGITINFPECMSDRYAVARLDIFPYGDCCPFGLSAHPSAASGKPELMDCSGQLVPATWTPEAVAVLPWTNNCFNEESVSPPPWKPVPADGAVDVPLTTELSWSIDPPVGCGVPSGLRANVYFGTTPDPPFFVGDIEEMRAAVGPLVPGTTYYWKAWVANYGVNVMGPVWSFRTAGPVSTETTTWGRIKALYRN